jgi:hypothetical protein
MPTADDIEGGYTKLEWLCIYFTSGSLGLTVLMCACVKEGLEYCSIHEYCLNGEL